jgi:hypothetical protein
VTDNEIKLNDVINTDTKTVTLKMQNGATWILDEKTKFRVVEYQGNKGIYELIEGDLANYAAGKKSAEAVIRINKQNYIVKANAQVEVSYDNDVTTVAVSEGSVKFTGGVISKGNTAKIDAQGKVEIRKSPKKRGIRG